MHLSLLLLPQRHLPQLLLLSLQLPLVLQMTCPSKLLVVDYRL